MIRETRAKTILNRHKRVDSWFMSSCGMNIYRGCAHNCAYCDGRSEKYRVDGDFGAEIIAKVNAPELLERILDPRGKRKPFPNGYIMVGGGVGDSYQPCEAKLGLTRKVLEILSRHPFPVHLLTKNCLVERDLDLIKEINNRSRAIVSMSFSSVNDQISKIVEPGSSPPSKRLKTLSRFKESGISTGMFLMPVIPFLTDSPEILYDTLKAAKDHGTDFVIFGTMTLKQGRQMEYFMAVINEHYPSLVVSYTHIYRDEKYGNSIPEYSDSISALFAIISKKLKIPKRIPSRLWSDLYSENEKIALMLEHLDYCLKLNKQKSPYGYAAYQISQLKEPVNDIIDLKKIKGVGPVTEKLIKEIIKTGKSTYLESVV